jgi:hypothetical protein
MARADSGSTGAAAASTDADERRLWQRRLLPLMSRMVVGLTVFFFVATFVQLLLLQAEIRPRSSIKPSDAILQLTVPENASIPDRLLIVRLRAQAELEVQLVERRYHQATILLMSRIWTRYLGFITGMILCLVGAAFILGRLQETTSELGVGPRTAPLTLKTASPGLILAALGTALMLVTAVTRERIDVVDAPLYLREVPAAVPPSPKLEPPRLGEPSIPIRPQ